MHFDFLDTQFQTFILRLLNSGFLLICTVLLFAIAGTIANKRLTRIIWRAAIFVGGFFLGRIIAGVLDSYYAFDVGWFSNIVNAAFWGKIVHKLYQAWKILRAPKNEPERVALREICDTLLDQLEEAKKNLRTLRSL